MHSEADIRRARRSRWLGPLIVIACALLGLGVFVGLTAYRFANGWVSEVNESDKAPIVTATRLEPLLKDLAIRRDKEEWTKIWFTGERCILNYRYEHPETDRPLLLESYVHTEKTRRDSFTEYTTLLPEYRSRFAAYYPGSEYVARDDEIQIEDQTSFGEYRVENEVVAYFFARRRGRHLYFGIVESPEIDEVLIGDVLSPPIDALDDWEPSP